MLEVCVGKKRNESKLVKDRISVRKWRKLRRNGEDGGYKSAKSKGIKYLGSTVQKSGSCEREVKRKVQAGWNGWKKVSGVICDRRFPARVKGKVYSSVVRPTMVCGLKTVAVTKKQVEEMEVAEMKMLTFAKEVTRKDKIKNEYIRGALKVEQC